MSKIKKISIISCAVLVCCFIISFIPKTALLIIGNSYESGKDINVVIMLNNAEVLYDGTLEKSTVLVNEMKKKKMKVGFYNVSAYLKGTNERMNAHFFYFFQNVIWIDFDMKKKPELILSTYYGKYNL